MNGDEPQIHLNSPSSRLRRNHSFQSEISSGIRGGNAGVTYQNNYARMQIAYHISFNNNVNSSPRLPDDIFNALLEEQREGVFYNLLPQGAILDTTRITLRNVHWTPLNYDEFEVYQYHNWQNSGRTLIVIYINLHEDSPMNKRNAYGHGTGFSVDLYMFYPWSNIRFFGNHLRIISSYQSRNGSLPSGHTNFNNTTWGLTEHERLLLSHFPNTYDIDLYEINTMSNS